MFLLLQRMHNHWPGGNRDMERGLRGSVDVVKLGGVSWGVMGKAWRGGSRGRA